MPRRRVSRKGWDRLCREVGPEDGVDPKERERGSPRSRRSSTRGPGGLPSWVKLPASANAEADPGGHGRKARQLGRQVARTLLDLFSGECRDDALRGLRVVSVEPAPNASHLLVTLEVIPGAEVSDPAELQARLARASGWLRAEVASAVTRRRAPNLTYRIRPATADRPDARA